jgi:hypothetical protein
MKTNDKLIKKQKETLLYLEMGYGERYLDDLHYQELRSEIIAHELSAVMIAFEAYASQSQPEKVTDEEIEKAAPFWKTERLSKFTPLRKDPIQEKGVSDKEVNSFIEKMAAKEMLTNAHYYEGMIDGANIFYKWYNQKRTINK